MRFAMENPTTETVYNCRQFMYLNFNWKNAKKKRFEMENPNTETAYNFRHYPYFNFKCQNTKKYGYCNGGDEYENCLQL